MSLRSRASIQKALAKRQILRLANPWGFSAGARNRQNVPIGAFIGFFGPRAEEMAEKPGLGKREENSGILLIQSGGRSDGSDAQFA